MPEFEVILQDAKTKRKYTISYEGLRRALKIDERIDYFIKRLTNLEDEFILSLKPQAKQMLLTLIRNNPNIRTGELSRFCYNNNTATRRALCHALYTLEKTGEISATSHGRGKHKTWNVKEAPV